MSRLKQVNLQFPVSFFTQFTQAAGTLPRPLGGCHIRQASDFSSTHTLACRHSLLSNLQFIAISVKK
jgi:hypothetical protein